MTESAALDPATVIRSKAYLSALVLAASSASRSRRSPTASWPWSRRSRHLFNDLPQDLFSGGTPAWWPVPWLVLCGLLTGLTIRYLPGNAGHSPAFGFHAGGATARGRDLPGIVLAALATLSLGAVLGPEAPLIAIGGGLAALTVHLVKKDAPPMAADDHGVGRQLRGDQHPARLARCSARS